MGDPAELHLDEGLDLGHAVVAHIAQETGVRLLVIKGALASRQLLRATKLSFDVDILVEPHRAGDVEEALIERGWFRVVENHTSIGVLPWHARTMANERWTADVDVHTHFPGFLRPADEVFDLFWDRRETHEFAHQPIPCIDVEAHALLLALHSIRTLRSAEGGDLEQVREIASTWDEPRQRALRDLADLTGAAWPLRTFFVELGQDEPPHPSPSPELEAWELLVDAPPGSAWTLELRRTPLIHVPRRLWRAAWLTEDHFRAAHPGTPPGKLPVLRLRLQRLVCAIPRMSAAVRATRGGRVRGPE